MLHSSAAEKRTWWQLGQRACSHILSQQHALMIPNSEHACVPLTLLCAFLITIWSSEFWFCVSFNNEFITSVRLHLVIHPHSNATLFVQDSSTHLCASRPRANVPNGYFICQSTFRFVRKCRLHIYFGLPMVRSKISISLQEKEPVNLSETPCTVPRSYCGNIRPIKERPVGTSMYRNFACILFTSLWRIPADHTY